MTKALLPVLFLVLLTGCVHHTPFTTEYFYQALGEKGEIVVTADTERIKDGELDEIIGDGLKKNAFFSRSTRVSLSLEKTDGEEGEYVTSGAVEGNISRFLTNTALRFSPQFSSEKDGGASYYSSGEVSLYSPKNGVLLFTGGDYGKFYRRSYTERKMLIDDITASRMADSAVSLYIFEPEGLVDIGFEIPEAVIDEIERTCLLFDRVNGEIMLSGWFEMSSEGTARALNTLFRNQIIQDGKRSGEKLDYAALSVIFKVDGSFLRISGYALGGEMLEKARLMMNERLGGIL